MFGFSMRWNRKPCLGLASPDSDYDVRFLYVRPMEEYLRLDSPRDVIEWQLDEVLDSTAGICERRSSSSKRGTRPCLSGPVRRLCTGHPRPGRKFTGRPSPIFQ